MSHTKLQWQHVGTTVYALEFDGWNCGKEVLRNRFYAQVQGYRDTPQEELEANARLMAAAQELLGALKLARMGLDAHLAHYKCKEGYSMFHATVFTLEKINSVIKKATGE